MPEREPQRFVDQIAEQVKHHSKEVAVIGLSGLSLSILGEKINNDPLLEIGAATFALSYILLGYSWGRQYLFEAINDAIEAISIGISKIKR